MAAERTQKKIKLLNALIDHPRTGEPERDAARRMLARLLAKAHTDGIQISDRGIVDHRVYGAKYQQVKNMTLPEIAKLMRQDIKLSRRIAQQAAEPGTLAVVDPIADMPAQIKISVTSQYYSGGGSIDIRIKNIPRAWGFSMQPDRWHPEEMREQPTAALRALIADLKVIHNAYNYDGGDITTDYFDQNYLGSVDYERPYDRA